MRQIFSYWFYPNLGTAPYNHPKVMAALIVCGILIALSFAIVAWRKRIKNPVTKKLSSSWSSSSLWFGIVGIGLAVSRAEGIQFLSMRILWAIWGLLLLAYIGFQMMQFQRRHYTVLERRKVNDVRDQYLPKKKR